MSDPSSTPRLSGPQIAALLYDPAVSFPLKAVLREWMQRDPVDAARDAELLAAALEGWAALRTGHIS